MSTTDIDNLFTNLDPVIDPAILDPVVNELNNARGSYNEVQQFIATNYNPPPSNHIWNGSDERYAYVQLRLRREHDILLEVGDEIPRGLELSSYTTPEANIGVEILIFLVRPRQLSECPTKLSHGQTQGFKMRKQEIQMADSQHTILTTRSVWTLLEATKLTIIIIRNMYTIIRI